VRALVTGCAGFIGATLTKRLLDQGIQVTGIDNLNSYYDPNLKLARLKNLVLKGPLWDFQQLDITDQKSIERLLQDKKFDFVIHLAAQVGVRNSIENPHDYVSTNCVGFHNLIEACRQNGIMKFIFASSSSVYGDNLNLPLRLDHRTDSPVSLYAATKKSNELIAHSYSHLFNMDTIGLRFFTVYGPWGRPDMAVFGFTKKITSGVPIQVYNDGNHTRDMTYIDDVVESLNRLISKMDATLATGKSQIFNIGNENPVRLMDLISLIESKLNKKANIEFLPAAPGDVLDTLSDSSDLYREIDYKPNTSIEDGIERFTEWFINYMEELKGNQL